MRALDEMGKFAHRGGNDPPFDAIGLVGREFDA